MWLFRDENCAPFLVEKEAYEGVRRIAEKVAEDVYQVSGIRPKLCENVKDCPKSVVLFATVGKSPLLTALENCGAVDIKQAVGKREVYGIRLLEKESGKTAGWQEIPELIEIEELCIIYGSDKRGTIYGMFHLSELMGVSPLHFWGDALPQKRKEMEINTSDEMISKEPSVRYRGFFINDEWPCFGNWTFHHYGGFTAEMYDKVFELLLRLKGNYLWPAMWTSSFALDGPGEESARLADIYGVIMGNSHHEPCLRAGEEWDIYRGENSIYGNEWNYSTNKEGLLCYWEDGLKRSGKYENIITVGMRGERDSVMLGAQNLQENIAILKDIITNQKKMIAELVDHEDYHAPMLLAIYKEVEEYFYGNSEVAGLKEWQGLEDVILMFCEDNFGHMRYLPERGEMHPGGYGMYYHLDYHGAPVSYEWINSTPLSAIWEQMTLAYEHGIRDVWMVNVGDLKGNEFPLSYFMELAYDYETWGNGHRNTARDFTKKWLGLQFGKGLTEEQNNQLTDVLTKGILLISKRRPEALNSKTYHPCNENEAAHILEEIAWLTEQLEEIKATLPKDCLPAFYSMIYDDLRMGLNLISMQIYAGKNAHYAKQGKTVANRYKKLVQECIERDRQLIAEAAGRRNGKWYGMKTGSHIGFQKWNEDGCRYPLTMQVEPHFRPRMIVSREDDTRVLLKNYGSCDTMEIYDFLYPGEETVAIEIANDGIGSFRVKIQMEHCSWLETELSKDEVAYQEILYLNCKKEALPENEEVCSISISDGDTTVQLNVHGRRTVTENLPERTFFSRNGFISILAEHYAKAEYIVLTPEEEKNVPMPAKEKREPVRENMVLKDFGLCGSGVKYVPNRTESVKQKEMVLTYYVMAEQAGEYQMELWSAPSNPTSPDAKVVYQVRNADVTNAWSRVEVFPKGYQAGEADCEFWAQGVLEQIHKNKTVISLKHGINQIEIKWSEENLVLEKIMIYPWRMQVKKSCMGPAETYFWSCK